MAFFLRWLTRGFLGLLFLILVAVAAWWGWSRPSFNPAAWQKYSSVEPTAIRIVRDNRGVPTIYSSSDAGAAYGLAWAHAEDDFETMQRALFSGAGVGGLADGFDGVAIDYVTGLMRIRETVSDRYETDLSEAFKAVLEGYADGLNAYAASHPQDVVSKDLFPITPQTVVANSTAFMTFLAGAGDGLSLALEAPVESADGSNGFAFNANITENGETVLILNPHNPYHGPIAWYEAQVQSEEGWVIHGGLFPGTPVFGMGVTPTAGWTHTLNFPDRTDIYKLTVNDDASAYLLDGEWTEFERFEIKLRIALVGRRFVLPVSRPGKWSAHGPVIESPSGNYFAFRTQALFDIRALEQLYTMNRARALDAFKAALSINAMAGFNVIYADADGNILFRGNGQIPKREPGYDWSEILPGDQSRLIWTELVENEALPGLLNPPSGYLFSVNAEVFSVTAPSDDINPASIPEWYGYPLETGMNRTARVREILDGVSALSIEDILSLRNDTCLPDTIRYKTDITAVFSMSPEDFAEIEAPLKDLQSWDRCFEPDRYGAAYFASMLETLGGFQPGTSEQVLTASEVSELILSTKLDFEARFGTSKVTYGQFLRHQGDGATFPGRGGFDTMTATGLEIGETGPALASSGDTLIMAAIWPKDGPLQLRTISSEGSSKRSDSPHRYDQVEDFVVRRLSERAFKQNPNWRETGYAPQ